ncbi:alpha/beta hydrolase [Nocardia sp. CDC160]|uniref:alpha/beta hydrolase n=1 Tax=Nocardia sp. CDC160 TaxID=3112166 RepID=UPI002DB9AFE5|nr:alpha/beta hydrolase family protein [Nocardia sp. CDC160]MEC3914035.1 alpha/beta hydrolase family protein [Nocardia sp. CDC160]
MRGDRRQRSRGWLKNSVVGLALAVALPFGVSVVEAGTASAALDPSGFDFYVDSASMGPVKSRVFRAADGNTSRVVYVLDGMRAQQDLSGWEINTDITHALTAANINVVMPIGGQSSFYADWNAPSSVLGVGDGGSSSGSSSLSSSGSASGSSSGSGAFQLLGGGPGKSYRYTWETFLSQDLPSALQSRLGFSRTRNGIFGLSMGGSGALTLAAYHPDQFSFAGSFSGYLNISAPGMREAIRLAMIDAGGYNVDSMAPPWGPQWLHMDPFVFAPRLRDANTRLWISAASAIPAAGDVTGIMPVIQGVPLEALALVNTRAFQARMMSLGANNVTYDFPATGVHNWNNWNAEVYRMLPDLSNNIG